VAVLRCFFPLLRTRSESANKNQKRMGGWIMKAKSLLLTVLIPVSGLTFLSSPASAECWMTCPPGTTATPSATGTQSATATAEPVASPEELTSAKKPKTTAKASPAPAKPKASPVPAGTTAEPVASPEELTPAKQTETTAKASPAPTPATSKAAPCQPRRRWRFRNLLRTTQRSNRPRLREQHQPLFQSQARCPARRRWT
jgi:cytoskeletal protein RodZ